MLHNNPNPTQAINSLTNPSRTINNHKLLNYLSNGRSNTIRENENMRMRRNTRF